MCVFKLDDNSNYFMVLIFSFQITQAELASIVSNLNKSDVLAANGIVLGGTKFM